MAGIGITKIAQNPVAHALRHGQPSIGTWLGLCSPVAAEALAHAGWDWLLVDVEHSLASFETMVECFRATQLGGAVPIARVPWSDTVWIQRTLDAGAFGILVPMINSVAEAEFVVRNTRYGPDGIRSFMRGRIAPYLDGDFRAWSDDNIAVLVMIETAEAVKNAEAILSVPGVDCGFVGPSDLALSMGHNVKTGPGSEHEALIQAALAAGKKVGKAMGIKCNNLEGPQRVVEGFQMIGVASDQAFMVKESVAQLQPIRQAIAGMAK
jgi:4-hydroxy-2-oxoheptanedioate aldolase